jgi:polyphosphate kinase
MNLKKRYNNRDLSWLQFNERVLQEAADESVPLIERLRFLGIFSNNLDEFFRVRYAGIKRIENQGKSKEHLLGGYHANELLQEITDVVIRHQAESLDILADIQHQLKTHHINVIDISDINYEQSEYIKDYFLQKVSPALVTIMLDELDEMPKLKDSRAYLAVKMIHIEAGVKRKRFVLIEIPKQVDRFVVLPPVGDQKYVILLDDLIRFNLDVIFNIFDYRELSAHMIKITRDAQLDLEGDLSKSYVEQLMESVKDRVDGDPVRFVYDKNIGKDTLKFLLDKMEIDDDDSIIPGGRYHNRRDYMKFPDLGAKHLLYDKIQPLPFSGVQFKGSLLKEIKSKDYLLYAPYQTFSYTVKFLREAALDPKVKAISITIYRLAEVSHIASSLINAAKNGKKVTVSIELQARFDEANNIRYSDVMQREGINLIFGVTGLKVHAKACVIDRLENNKVKNYGFISTGNFNENTAKIYTDYTLFTSHKGILSDVSKMFNFFEVNYKIYRYNHLIISPHYTRNKFYKLIDREIRHKKEGKHAELRFKMNSLSDFQMIDKLYEASNAGVKVKLVVRGICCLIPGVKGMSENIEAISIVDKFLEHPRLYIFENGGDKAYYISSADLMTRNLDKRVELTCPVYDLELQQELDDTFEISWKDNVKARDLSSKNQITYRKNDESPTRSQFATYEYYKDKLEAQHNA